MSQTPHIERHFTAGETVRDIVIGISDGRTVPFALAAGLSGAVASTQIVVTAGFAEVAAGSGITMNSHRPLPPSSSVLQVLDHFANDKGKATSLADTSRDQGSRSSPPDHD